MKIIIACTSKKRDGGSFKSNGETVKFVAHPEYAPHSDHYIYARPDDISDDGRLSWWERLRDYNENYKNTKENPCNMLPAFELYKNPIFEKLVNEFCIENVFIISAGWGIIPADYLTPIYDITASNRGEAHSKIKIEDTLKKVPNMLPDNGEDIIFLGGKDYQKLFHKLFRNYEGEKIIFYYCQPDLTAQRSKDNDGFELRPYQSSNPRKWYYECAEEICFVKKRLAIFDFLC